jgi:hypothetical protein
LKKFNLNYNDVEITKIENQSKVLSWFIFFISPAITIESISLKI